MQAIALSGPARGTQITRIWAASVLIAWQARLERQGQMGSALCARGLASWPVRTNPRSFSLTRSRSQCARPGADHYQHGRGGDLFTLAGPDVLERQGFQAGLAVAVGNSGAEPAARSSVT